MLQGFSIPVTHNRSMALYKYKLYGKICLHCGKIILTKITFINTQYFYCICLSALQLVEMLLCRNSR